MDMNFRDTNSKIIDFYAEFHKTFSEVDKKFQKLDVMGGSNQEIAIEIIGDLSKYHSRIYEETLLSTNEEIFLDLQQCVRRPDNSIDEYVFIVKKMQQTIHDFLVYDTQWPGQKECKEIIETILNNFSQNLTVSLAEENSYYAIIRILRELVADCSISIKGLYPLAKWSYGTIAYSCLTSNEQLVVLINQSILMDRMYFCIQSLEITLERLNKLAKGFEELDWTVYFVVGFLNFKIHQYDNAIYNFNKVKEHKDLKDSYAQSSRERYFHANLLIAYSYEYGHDFERAIKTLVIEPSQIDLILEKYAINLIDLSFDEIMNAICLCAEENSLINEYMPSYSFFSQKANKPSPENEPELEMQFEILHALAHCINEYAIKNRAEKHKNDSVNYGKFIRLARCIMKKIALIRPEYWTCYATIHGEYQDYHKALYELDNAKNKLISYNNGIGKETLIAEVSFFKYYFNLFCNYVSKSDKEAFEQYYEKYDDDDAKCHLKIFEFRDELRRYLSLLYNNLYNDLDGILLDEEGILKISYDLQKKYIELCSLEPTLYMNANVRTELRLMQRAYVCIENLREYLINPSAYNLVILRNSAYRFSVTKNLFKIVDTAEEDEFEKDILQLLPYAVRNAFSSGTASILNSLFNTDSIFILAPISGVVVYQYQTGTVQELFDSKSIMPQIEDAICERDNIEAIVHALFGVYSKLSAAAGQREIININWNKLSKYTNVIYYWRNNEAVSSQVLVAENGKSSYIRQIEDVKTFTETMAQIKKSFDGDSKRALCKDREVRRTNRNLKCTLQVVELPWLEIINENEECRLFYIAWDDSVESTTDRDTIICFMLPCANQDAPKGRTLRKCSNELHQYIRQIEVKYKPDDLNTDMGTVSDQDETDNKLCDYGIGEKTKEPEHQNDELYEMVDKLREEVSAKKGDIEHELRKMRNQIDKYKSDPDNPNALPIKNKKDKYCQMLSQIELINDYVKQDIFKIDISKLIEYQNILSQIEVH